MTPPHPTERVDGERHPEPPPVRPTVMAMRSIQRQGRQRLRRVRRAVYAVTALAAAGACAAVGGGGKTCPAIGVFQGITMTVAPSDAEEVESASLELCQDGDCDDHDLAFSLETRNGEEQCEEGACSVTAEETGGLLTRVPLSDLTAEPVDVAVALYDADGEELVSDRLATEPDIAGADDDCLPETPQLALRIEDGSLQKRG